MAQLKEQIKTPEKEIAYLHFIYLLDADFKTLFIRMLKKLSKDLNSIKKIQSETKDMLIEIRNNLQGNRVDKAENQINYVKIREQKTHKRNPKKNEDSISSLWDNFKRSKICIIGTPEEEKDQENGNLLEKTVKENVPNLVKEIDMQVQEAESPKQNGYKEAHSKIHN